MPRVTLVILTIIVVAFIIASAVTYVGVYRNTGSADGDVTLFGVQAGESLASIIERLSRDGFIEHSTVVKVFARVLKYDRQIKVGTYQLVPGEAPKSILRKLVTGDVYKVSVTIPEGFIQRQIAGELAAIASVDSASFVGLADDAEARSELGVDAPTLEGWLFPDTYVLPWGADAKSVARTMIERMEEVFDPPLQERSQAIGMSRNEVLTLASIVEAETRLAEELHQVSAVYHNRLRKSMRLEADPTVAYAMGGYKGRLYYKDLEIDSPYNTYLYEGLPPAPICSPGKAAIVAALYPDTTCQAIYFVARGDGGHVFSNTLSDHLAAVREFRKRRAAQIKSGK